MYNISEIIKNIEDTYNKEIEDNIYFLSNKLDNLEFNNNELKKKNKILQEKLDNLTSSFCMLENNYNAKVNLKF